LKILVTCPPMLALREEFEPILLSQGIEPVCPEVTQTLTEEQLIELLPGCDGRIIGDDPATEQVVMAAKAGGLRAAVKWGVGVDNIDFEAFSKANIEIKNTPNMFGNEVADIAMGYVIGLARKTHSIDRAVRAGHWPKPQGMSLQGKVAGIIGFGDVGTNLAKRLLVSGMKVLAFDPEVEDTDMEGVNIHSWPEHAEDCDFLVLCCSLNSSTRKMLNAESLGLCKTGVLLVNVSRGGLIDQNDLVSALEAGKVGGAALDVFEVEPIPASSALLSLDQCIFGSHNASNTIDAARKTNHKAMSTLLALLDVAR